jgi:predicted PurR-regulated permease PerM
MIKLAAFVVIVAGVMAASSVITPVLLALFIGIICVPPLEWLNSKNIGLELSVAIVLLSITLLILGLGLILGDSFASFAGNAPKYEATLTEMVKSSIRSLNEYGLNISVGDIIKIADPAKIMQYTARVVSELGGFMSYSLLIFFILLFLMLEVYGLRVKTRAIADESAEEAVLYIRSITDTIRVYLGYKTLISLATGFLIWIWLTVVGVDYAVLWALIAFLLNYIPNIGSIIAGIPAVLLALVQLGVGGALWTALGYGIVNMIIGNLVEPKVLGDGLGLSTLVIFLSLIFWGFIFGTVGMFLAVPLTITAKLMLEHNKKTHWIAVLLGTEKSAQKIIDTRNSSDAGI